MKHVLARAMPQLLSASTPKEAFACLIEIAFAIGFSGFLLARRDMTLGWTFDTNWPDAFVASHFGPLGIAPNPVTTRMASGHSLFWWGDGDEWSDYANAAFLASAREAGIISACSVPAFDAWGLSVACHLSSATVIAPNAEISKGLFSLLGLFLNTIQDMTQQPPVNDLRQLTRREIEVLALAARGSSNRKIAEGLSISENSVEFHLRNIFDKLEVDLPWASSSSLK